MNTPERKPSDRKTIIGVPVLPIPGPRKSASSVSSVSSVDEPTGVIQEGAVQEVEGATPNEPQWKLRHVDFMPMQIKSKKDDDYETFQTLVERSNSWARENPQALVFTCESMSWCSTDKSVYTDNALMQKSMHSDKKTRFFRGLRLWYVVLEETFYDKASSPGSPLLSYIDYTPQNKNDDTSALLKRVNEDVFRKKFRGKIAKVETLHHNTDCADSGVCMWKEQPENARDYVSFLRVFSLAKPGEPPASAKDIGFYDILPSLDQRTVHNAGYEVYADMWRHAARWLYTNPKQKCINLHSFFVKYKKGQDTDDGTSHLWERCNHREHGSAHGAIRAEKTEYFQVLRLVYCKSEEAEPSPKKMLYKCFSPVRLLRPSVPDDPEQLESTYEDLRTTEDKVNAWLGFSGAKVFGVETVPTRLTTGGQESLGPEATFVVNGRERNVGREYWKNHIRLYLEGEYREPVISWHSRVVEQSTVGVANHN